MQGDERQSPQTCFTIYASITPTSRSKQPVMVGLDPLGVDVRGRFEVYRVPASRPIEQR